MTSGSFRFDRFHLDPGDRRLTRDGAPVELNARYLDALALLVREQGKLVSKDRFMEEIWRGTPVTDEALTQCVRTLRRQLGDDAGAPRFIETVPKHGYRFIAPVEAVDQPPGPPAAAAPSPAPAAGVPPVWSRRQFLLLGSAGTVGGGLAGVLIGLFYGFAAASQSDGAGAVSMVLVLVFLSIVLGLLAGGGVAFGIATAGFPSGRPGPLTIVGGAAGGLVVGAFGKLLGLDAFNLLFGRSPGDITGAPEGVLLGAALGLGTWLAGRRGGPRLLGRSIAAAGACGAAAGVLAILLGGRLMGGSLDLLAHGFPDSRLRLAQMGGLFGEDGFGRVTQTITGALEGGLFGAGVVGAIILARRSLNGPAL